MEHTLRFATKKYYNEIEQETAQIQRCRIQIPLYVESNDESVPGISKLCRGRVELSRRWILNFEIVI
jgi:hypothetical protein